MNLYDMTGIHIKTIMSLIERGHILTYENPLLITSNRLLYASFKLC